MNAYPDDYVVHNLPLVILTGLQPTTTPETPYVEKSFEYLGDGGFRIRAELPSLHHPSTPDLRLALLAHDRSQAPWRPQSMDKSEQLSVFKVRSVGRAYTFPPRKAPPPPHSPRMRPANDNGISPAPLTLHSTLSPLSPSSPLYPDGIVTPLWLTKHQYRLPSVLVSFYNLIADPSTSSLEDNKIKNEINAIRSLITSTNYKTKFVIVLVADGPINPSTLEERLVNIRRGTNFDTKALYYLPSSSSLTEINDFAKVLFTTLYPSSIEYYRDLSKHARRKRNRNSVPAPTLPPTQGTSSPLSPQGWNVRYEFKLAIFAETRQELEAAARNYEQAYEALFHVEVFDAIPEWSPRFNETRMLADIIAIRIIRCALWSSQTMLAVKWWMKHRDRVRDLVDRRGKGTQNYGWEVWQSIWSKVMADILERTEVFAAAQSQLPPGYTLSPQILPDRNMMTLERQLPWEHLHHEGYWLNKVRKHIEARRELAALIPDEDRIPANSTIELTKRKLPYDTYLTPKPATECLLFDKRGETYTNRIADTLDATISFFRARGQRRMADLLSHDQSLVFANSNEWSKAAGTSKALLHDCSWKTQGWWLISTTVGKSILRTATELEDRDLCLRLLWELAISDGIPPSPNTLTEPLATALDLNGSLSQIVPSFAFAAASGHVGEPIAVQFSLYYTVEKLPLNLHVKEVRISFDGGINPVLLLTQSSPEENQVRPLVTVDDIDVSEFDVGTSDGTKRLSLSGRSYWSGKANLGSNGKRTEVYNFNIVPRESGPVTAASIAILLTDGSQELTLNATDINHLDPRWWELRDAKPTSREFGMQRDVTTLNVLPKPPKVDIHLPNFSAAYYTNEKLSLRVSMINGEDEVINGKLQARLISPDSGVVELDWQGVESTTTMSDGDIKEIVLSPVTVREMAPNADQSFTLQVSGLTESVDHELELQLTYALESDSSNILTKQMVVDLPVVRPFETTAVFQPRLREGAWPNFFAVPSSSIPTGPRGLEQKFLVKADIGCFAQESLVIHSLGLNSRRIVGEAVCSASTGRQNISPIGNDGVSINPNKTSQFFFDLDIQKLVLGDRSPVAADFVIDINWSRQNSEDINTSTLALPRFLAPMSEPRVLLQTKRIENRAAMHLLTYTIENPSMHLLTFNLSMESGDGYAFSGPKLKSVSLVPLSRYELHYHLLMQRSNEWVKIQLEVLDAFFGQTLKVQPASEGIRVDKQGHIQLWSES